MNIAKKFGLYIRARTTDDDRLFIDLMKMKRNGKAKIKRSVEVARCF